MRWRTKTTLLVGGVAVALAAGAGATWFFVQDAARDAGAENAQQKTDDLDAQVAARTAIADRFPMATTIAYGAIKVNKLGDVPAVCGQVDIDEPSDSFEGMERFVFVDGALTLEETDGSGETEARWKDVCEG